MTRQLFHFIFFFVAISFIVASCKKEEQASYKPTPISPTIPSWAMQGFSLHELSGGNSNPMTREGVLLGEKLFFDTRLSGNGTMSCATCHVPALGFSDPNQFSTGIGGEKGNRNAMPLFNLAWTHMFFWDGRVHSLEAQAHDPVVNPIEMHADWNIVAAKLQNDAMYPILFYRAFGSGIIDSMAVTKAIAQYERSLLSFSSKFDRFYYDKDSSVFSESELRGYSIFMTKANCFLCHNAPQFTDFHFSNNGLDIVLNDNGLGAITNNKEDNGKFKIPSLRNIALTAPYMHDGRFKTLEEVVDFYNSGVKAASPNLDPHMNFPFVRTPNFLNDNEKKDLVQFLKTLTDNKFVQNPQYSINP